MMRHTRKFMFIALILALSLACAIPVFAQKAVEPPPPMAPTTAQPGVGIKEAPAGTLRGGAMMPVDVYTPLAKGYDMVQAGNYDGAKFEFATATKLDKLNPFALNNLAVMDERDGKLNDALAHLKDGTIHAAEYKDKVSQTCFVGGGCMAVKPVRAVASNSEILPILQENIAKLEGKMKAAGTPPQPSSPPPMSPEPKK